MGNEHGKLPSGIDLVRSAQNHYEFIQQVHFLPHLFHRNVVRLAIMRYEVFWLPFVSHHANQKLTAPIDIELIWTVHMHNPAAYEKDCFEIAG